MLPPSEVEAPERRGRPLACRGLAKSFGQTRALDGVDLEIQAGEIHGLVGQNGAGKSTLLGLLTGRIRPTSGSIEAGGTVWDGMSIRNATRNGIRAVYQELTLVPALDAVQNVFLGQEDTWSGVLAARHMNEKFEELCADLQVKVPTGIPVRDLSVAQQQLVEILRAVNSEARVILFDEPTAALPERERVAVLDTMRTLRDRGVGLLFITHGLDEILEVADRVTVLRAGATVRTAPASEWNRESLISAMSGEYQNFQPKLGAQGDQSPVLTVENLCLPGALESVDLTLRPGEIVGLAGLVGAGRTSIMRCIAGAERRATGRMWIDGQEVDWPRTVKRGLRHGITLLPEDRKNQGLHLMRSIADNVTLMNLADVSNGGVVQDKSQREVVSQLADQVALPPYAAGTLVGQLSGGNQQKVLLSKALHSKPRVLLADEPTRGVDITAKISIMESLRQLASEGMAILVTSSEIEDVLNIADSVLVVVDGRIAMTLDTHDRSVSVEDILHIAFEPGVRTDAEPGAMGGGAA